MTLTKHLRRRVVQATFSPQAIAVLDALVATGLHGASRPEVVRRLVDAALERYVIPPRIALRVLTTDAKRRYGGDE